MLDILRRIIIPPPVTRKQKRLAIIAAGFVDFLQMLTWPITVVPVINTWGDIVAAIALVLICGFRWQFVVGFAIEAIPIVALCPTWLAVAILLPVKDDTPVVKRDVTPYVVAEQNKLPAGDEAEPQTKT